MYLLRYSIKPNKRNKILQRLIYFITINNQHIGLVIYFFPFNFPISKLKIQATMLDCPRKRGTIIRVSVIKLFFISFDQKRLKG